MLAAEQLRAHADQGGSLEIHFDAAGLLMLADMQEISDSSARCDIECHCGHAVPREPSPRHWYDLAAADPEDREHIDQAVRYLTSRQLLDRHPENENWVSPRSPE